MGQQSNSIPDSNAASPDIEPRQVVGPQLGVISSSGSTGTVPHPVENPQWDYASNSNPAADPDPHLAGFPSGDVSVPDTTTGPMLFGGEAPNANIAQVAPPQIAPSPSSSPLDISDRYTRSNQKLIFLLSTIVALIAFLIQYELVQEMSHGSAEIVTRPSWAHFRDKGIKERQ